jgi:hypothetical protein
MGAKGPLLEKADNFDGILELYWFNIKY